MKNKHFLASFAAALLCVCTPITAAAQNAAGVEKSAGAPQTAGDAPAKSAATSAAQQADEPVLTQAVLLHNAAPETDDGTLGRAMELLKPLIDRNMTARAYYGSSLTKQANYIHKKNPIKSLSLLSEGTGYIDDAVAREPDSMTLRCLRLIHGMQMSISSPVKRYSVVKHDVAWLDENAQHLTGTDGANVFLYMGLYFIKSNDIDHALVYFEKAVSSAPSSPEGKEAAALIKRYEE